MFKFLTNHLKDTGNPQTYFQHFRVAFVNSCWLLIASIAGIIHAIFPWWFPFYTSTVIIKCFKILVDTERHKEEFKEIIPDYLKKD
jgi:hypothetical protein